jgi:hypothetical protein
VYSASRYNNGQPAATVRLQPMDGILLQSDQPSFASPFFGGVTRYSDHLTLNVTNLTPGLSYSLQSSGTLASNSWLTLQTFSPMGFATNLTENPSSNRTSTFYRLRGN